MKSPAIKNGRTFLLVDERRTFAFTQMLTLKLSIIMSSCDDHDFAKYHNLSYD